MISSYFPKFYFLLDIVFKKYSLVYKLMRHYKCLFGFPEVTRFYITFKYFSLKYLYQLLKLASFDIDLLSNTKYLLNYLKNLNNFLGTTNFVSFTLSNSIDCVMYKHINLYMVDYFSSAYSKLHHEIHSGVVNKYILAI